jgi:hypothetical protein
MKNRSGFLPLPARVYYINIIIKSDASFFRFFASKKHHKKLGFQHIVPTFADTIAAVNTPVGNTAGFENRLYRLFSTQHIPTIFPPEAGKIAVHTHAVREPIPNTLGRLELMKQNFNYEKDKSYEKATLHSRNPSFQPVQFCRVRRPDRQHPVRLQRRKKAEERSFRIHDQ